MPEHEQLAAYVLGRLEPDEAARFAEHLAGCVRCREEEAGLREVSALVRGVRPAPLPADLEERTLAAVAAAADEAGPRVTLLDPPRRRDGQPTDVGLVRRRRFRIAGTALAAAAGLALAFVLGAGTAKDTTTTVASVLTRTFPDTTLPGSEEKRATLRGAQEVADVRVNVVGPGRLVQVRSTTVARVPKGTYYELWFVGPGDTPAHRNRISAGTWHPDTKGVTDVRFLIAADPAKFPRIEVTREPPDGDPRPSARAVLAAG